ncbi:MAG: hypothetical protein V7L09_30480, partial [Nostoc sp.]|uniref:hypothetical protein n=1 Tax=Nostoc sp. TaxID=1180 RepID=UPI002FF13D74
NYSSSSYWDYLVSGICDINQTCVDLLNHHRGNWHQRKSVKEAGSRWSLSVVEVGQGAGGGH